MAQCRVSTKLSVPSSGLPKKQLSEEKNAKSTRRPFAAPPILVGWESSTWRNSLGPSDSVGLGWSGRIRKNYGLVWATHAVRLIWIFSMPPLPSPPGMEGRHLFGMLLGCMARDRWTLRLSFLRPASASDGPCMFPHEG